MKLKMQFSISAVLFAVVAICASTYLFFKPQRDYLLVLDESNIVYKINSEDEYVIEIHENSSFESDVAYTINRPRVNGCGIYCDVTDSVVYFLSHSHGKTGFQFVIVDLRYNVISSKQCHARVADLVIHNLGECGKINRLLEIFTNVTNITIDYKPESFQEILYAIDSGNSVVVEVQDIGDNITRSVEDIEKSIIDSPSRRFKIKCIPTNCIQQQDYAALIAKYPSNVAYASNEVAAVD